MLEKTFSLLFYLKKPKDYELGAKPIYFRITVDGISKEISLGRRIEPSKWNSNAGRAIGAKEDMRKLNSFLDTVQNNVYDARLQLLEKKREITAELLIGMLRGFTEPTVMIMKVFQKHNDEIKGLVGKDYSAGTLERYRTSYEHTRSFMQSKYGVNDMDVRKLDYEFVTQYEYWLKTVRNCGHNSTLKYIANFKKIVIRCIKYGHLTQDPFFAFKMSKKEVTPEFLTSEEIERIRQKKFGTDRLNQVRDIFLFCCYTGLAFADVRKLRISEITEGVDKEKWIFTSRQKTETISRIPLLPVALIILEKYREHPTCVNTGRVLPVACNQKYNEYLKEIAALCGIQKKLTSHAARHTFATTVTLANGVPIESVSKMLGHKNLKTTQHYARVLDVKIGADMKLLKEKFATEK